MSTVSGNRALRALIAASAAIAAALMPLSVGLAQVASGLPQPVLAAGSTSVWSSQSSGTSEILWSVSCPSATVCFAVGESGTILHTENGGATWSSQATGTTNRLESVSCPSSTTCYVVGPFPPTILITTDGGSTWSDHSAAAPSPLAAISCSNTNSCVAVGIAGAILVTHDGGSTWFAQNTSSDFLFGVSCPSDMSCIAVGNFGAVLTTADGGTTWSSQNSGTDRSLVGIDCLSTATCLVVGASSPRVGGHIILTTDDGGINWSNRRALDVGPALFGVGCTSLSSCAAVGESGTILVTSDGGSTWASQDSGTTSFLQSVSCSNPITCFAVGRQGTILVSHNVGAADVVVPRGGVVQIAVVLPFTGFAADVGQGALNGVRLAVEKHSRIVVCRRLHRGPDDLRQLPCHGKPIDDRSLVTGSVRASASGREGEDGQGFVIQLNPFNGPCGPDAGQNVLAANQVVANPQNVAVIGHFCSAGFSAALPVYEGAGVVAISGTATSPLLPSFGPDVFNDVAISDACCPFQDNFDPWYNTVSQLPRDRFWRQHTYPREFGTLPPAFADLYYDAASLLLDKIASTASLADDGSLVIDRAALAQAVRTTAGFDGVTCDMTLASNGFRVNDPASLARCASPGGGEGLD